MSFDMSRHLPRNLGTSEVCHVVSRHLPRNLGTLEICHVVSRHVAKTFGVMPPQWLVWAKISRVATEGISWYYCRFDINLIDLTAILRCWYILPPDMLSDRARLRAERKISPVGPNVATCRDICQGSGTCGVMSRRDICHKS